ncbi:MAG: hypothetical protein V3T20_08455 [Gemmatimonadota bacterium]
MTKSTNTHARRGATSKRASTAWICVAVVVVVAGIVWRVSGSRPESVEPSGREVTLARAPAIPDVVVVDAQRLTGRWVRADAPYVIEIASAADDGSLEAAYYNPRVINVSHAESRVIDGTLEVFVELRDVNYPGSTYTLRYDAADDVLQGVYFQAVLRQSFDVVFVRQRTEAEPSAQSE